MDLKGRVAIVTGGDAGIGRAASVLLGQRGATVVIVAGDQDGGEGVVNSIRQSGGQATFLAADMSSQTDVERVVPFVMATYGRLDILVNNAALGSYGTITQTTPEAWDALMNLNLRSVYLITKAAVNEMSARGGGSIVNVSSQLGMVGDINHAAYCATKGGLVQLTRAMALDHAADNIRVSCVCPGPIMSLNLDIQFQSQPNREAEIARVTSKIPMKRIGEPEEVAPLIAFLASDEATYITGAIIPVDGGWTAQ